MLPTTFCRDSDASDSTNKGGLVSGIKSLWPNVVVSRCWRGASLGQSFLRRSIVHAAHRETGEESQQRRRAGAFAIAASLPGGGRQELLRFAEKDAADFDCEDQALGTRQIEDANGKGLPRRGE